MKLKTTAVTGVRVALAVLAVSASPFALADGSTGWYGGVNMGQSSATIDQARIIGGLRSSGFGTATFDRDEHDFGYRIFGGYQFNRFFALEGGYFDMGKFGFQATTVPTGTLNGNLKLKGGSLDALGFVPVFGPFSIFGRVGVTYASASDSFSGTGAVNVLDSNPSKSAFNYKFGVGVQYQITRALAMRAEAERYRINDAVGNKGDIDLISLGLLYRFGPKPSVGAMTPVGAAAAPALPEPVAIAPAPVPRRVTFSADSLFDFDKATVKPAGKQALDRFAAQLRGSTFDVVTVTGHTDRIGSHSYNMNLSMRRAEAVKAELLETLGIPASRIVTRGVDGADPVTRPGECLGDKPSQRLITCLQPDRRVEVEVSGTQ